jgi:Zn-finger nucleic acid-binding protein
MTDRQGVEIDYCPQCRGVWLDRGELDKIIERAAPATAAQPRPASPEPRYREPDYPPAQGKHGYGHDDHHGKHGHGGSYKKKSLLGDLFDF